MQRIGMPTFCMHQTDYPEIEAEGRTPAEARDRLVQLLVRAIDFTSEVWRCQALGLALIDARGFNRPFTAGAGTERDSPASRRSARPGPPASVGMPRSSKESIHGTLPRSIDGRRPGPIRRDRRIHRGRGGSRPPGVAGAVLAPRWYPGPARWPVLPDPRRWTGRGADRGEFRSGCRGGGMLRCSRATAGSSDERDGPGPAGSPRSGPNRPTVPRLDSWSPRRWQTQPDHP